MHENFLLRYTESDKGDSFHKARNFNGEIQGVEGGTAFLGIHLLPFRLYLARLPLHAPYLDPGSEWTERTEEVPT